MIDLNSKISGNFVEMPLSVFIELANSFIKQFNPEQVLNIEVLIMQSGNTLHVYTRPNDDENGAIQNDD